MTFTPETIQQYGLLTAALGAVFSAFVLALIYKGIPAFFNYLSKMAALRQEKEEVENQTQQVENKKDLALIRAQQVLEDENTALRNTNRLQAAQVLEQANEISRLKNFESAVDEYRRQRTLLLEWIEEQTGTHLNRENLILQMRNEILILTSMVDPEYKDANSMSDKPP